MKIQAIKHSIGNALFLAVIFSAFLLIYPIYNRLQSELDVRRILYIQKLENFAGIGLSYRSLSPSILAAFRVKDIVVYDPETKKPLLTIDRAVIFYDIRRLLTGDFDHAFTRLIVSGAAIDYDEFSGARVKTKLLELLTNRNKEPASFSLPFDVQIRGITLRYTGQYAEGSAAIKSLSYLSGQGIFGEIKLRGSLSASLTEAGKAKVPETARRALDNLASVFSLSVSLSPKLAGSHASVSLESLRTRDFQAAKLNLLAEYTGNTIRVSSLQTGFPFFFIAEAPVSLDSLNIRLQAQAFNPFAMITVAGDYPWVRQIAGTTFSGLYTLSLSGPQNSFDYTASGSLRLPNRIVPGGGSVSYNIRGNRESLTLSSLNIAMKQMDASFEGSVNLKTMQPSGTMDIKRLTLWNGNQISAEAYFDPIPGGVLCFLPQVFLGDRTLTAVQATVIPQNQSADFSIEASDYSHYEYDVPALIRIDGSLLFTEGYFVQAHISTQNFFVDSLLRLGAVFLPQDYAAYLENAAPYTEPYILTNEIYVSTDFSSVSYNIPYSILANTRKDRQFAVFAADGNETSVHLSQFDGIYANQIVRATMQADISPDYYDLFFVTDLTLNRIPYSFSGNFVPGVMIGVTGSYGFAASVLFPENKGESFTGSLKMGNFPIAIGQYIAALSTDISLIRSRNNEPLLLFPQLEITELSDSFSRNPRLILSGSANQRSANFESISFADTASQLNGSGTVSWNITGNVLNSASALLQMVNPASPERYDLNISVSNPNRTPFSLRAAQEDYVFSGAGTIASLPTGRFLANQQPNNTISLQMYAWGTFHDPNITAQVTDSSGILGIVPLAAQGQISLSGKSLRISQASLDSGPHSFRNLELDFSLDTFDGFARSLYNLNLGANSISAPLVFTFESGSFPEDFALEISSTGFTSALFDKPKPLILDIIRTSDRLDLLTVNTGALRGWLTDSGDMSFTAGGEMPVKFVLTGQIRQNNLNLDMKNLTADMSAFSKLIAYPPITVYRALVNGNMHIGGTLQYPEFSGRLTGRNIEIASPAYVTENVIASSASFEIEANQLALEMPVSFTSDSGGILLESLELLMDGWRFERLGLKISTPKNIYLPAEVSLPLIHITAQGGCNLDIQLSPETVFVSGSVFAQNGTIEIAQIQGEEGASSADSRDPLAVDIELAITTGNRLQMSVAQIIRGLITPGTSVSVRLDSSANMLTVQGDAILRGGEIEYFNRTFYIREGRVSFDRHDATFDPVLTIRAETREQDAEGEQVRIILSAVNQRLSEFTAVFSSVPARSEAEIMALLGQMLTGGDAEDPSFLLGMGVNFLAQQMVVRRMEAGLRDLLKFDIFSLRTMAVQNIIENQLNSVKTQKNMAGILFDNTTVYIGKYFGGSVYGDILVHILYNEALELSNPDSGGILIQPEIGLELNSPFPAFPVIRLSLAPEFGGNELTPATFVSASSITLTWKLSL
ncbi:MAG: translocation/assembly module TamB domain-containing protein [Treponema sp.]|jgi:hypothetical protein|nr:translocation/assembly module TamB domain-containing protein [Treponema sp.]